MITPTGANYTTDVFNFIFNHEGFANGLPYLDTATPHRVRLAELLSKIRKEAA